MSRTNFDMLLQAGCSDARFLIFLLCCASGLQANNMGIINYINKNGGIWR